MQEESKVAFLQNLSAQRWYPLFLWISVVAVVGFGFLLSQDALAKIAWQKYGRPDVALRLVRSDSELAMQLGSYYFGGTIGKSEYDLDKAERAYRRAVAVNPGILWGHYQIARILFVKGDHNAALEEINKELEANPENLRSLYARGLVYGYRNSSGDLEKAEADFRRFTLWAPKEWAGYNDLAWILSKNQRFSEAAAAIEQALREIPEGKKNPWLWNALGVAELNLKNYREAEVAFRNAQALAEKITPAEWRSAYPGNNPAAAAEGIAAFRRAISGNLNRATKFGHGGT